MRSGNAIIPSSKRLQAARICATENSRERTAPFDNWESYHNRLIHRAKLLEYVLPQNSCPVVQGSREQQIPLTGSGRPLDRTAEKRQLRSG